MAFSPTYPSFQRNWVEWERGSNRQASQKGFSLRLVGWRLCGALALCCASAGSCWFRGSSSPLVVSSRIASSSSSWSILFFFVEAISEARFAGERSPMPRGSSGDGFFPIPTELMFCFGVKF
eukprot:6174206-Pleurochrysis_carterae.AAC.1